MRIWGKLVGFVIGLVVTRDFGGALIGLLIGHLVFDSGWLAGLTQTGGKDGYVEPLFSIMGTLAKSDGRVSEAEVAIVEKLMTRLELDALWRRRAIDAFNKGKAPGFDLSRSLVDLRSWCLPRRSSVMPFLDMLCDVAMADGPLTDEKVRVLKRVAFSLRISEIQLVALLAMKGFAWNTGPRPGEWAHSGAYSQQGYRPAPRSNGPDPYTVLGVPRDADERTIKRAYRKLISEFHPDRLGNMPEDLRRRAEARASEINAAWERIQAERGFR
ncbi:MAG TPA: co-chaperone DjlA [Rhodanobacteraceae bacterium]|jgi:DnaJ like chaperone protein|nr:co-chaperone DjlA [Rhodanobacteraceae bacterium]